MISPKSVLVQVYSITGALVASYYNNTLSGENLIVECNEKRNGGLDLFSFIIPADSDEPFFSDMECRIYVGGVWWYSGYAVVIPQKDTDEPVIKIEGKGFFHKLSEKTINVSYAAQTLDFIINDIASNYLGSDISVFYNIAKINVPVVSDITIDFEDKDLKEIFSTLNSIANKDYNTQQYNFGVDEEKELYFQPVDNALQAHYFEGYDYQFPDVGLLSDRIVNRILTYRTTAADSKAVEFVALYENVESQSLYGLFEKKLTFPDFIDTVTIADIANNILEKYGNPIDRIEVKELPVTEKLNLGFYALSNRRDKYYLSVNEMEDLAGWDVTGLNNTVASVSNEQVFNGRSSIKLVTSAGAAGDFMEYVLPQPIRFPELFRVFVFLADINGGMTIRIIDSNNNTVDLDFTGELFGEWIKRLAEISLLLSSGNMTVDVNGVTEGTMAVDVTGAIEGGLAVDNLVREGVIDIVKIQIIINTNLASVMYVDSMQSKANTYLYRKIILEEVSYTLNKSYLADVVYGEKIDSLIDEIDKDVRAGNVALSVFSKQ